MPKNTLYVTGFTRESKAADLAPDFEKFGELVRLDIPPPRSDDGQKYAFVEYKDAESCERALELDGQTLPYSIKDGLVVQVARSDPYRVRQHYGGGGGGRGYGGGGYRDGGRGYGYRDGGYRDGGYRDGGYRDRGRYGGRRGGYGGYGGYRDDRRGGYRDDRRGGYGDDRRGGYGDDRRRDDYRRDEGRRGYDRDEGGRRGYEREEGGRAEERRYSRSPSRSPPRRERSRSPEHF
ncbi:Pre-mRNA-splicing factor srp1 [Candida viswanathii]|uniref:Pre-mRNA-splicing factor srp1 n=1 Tax=Candida viswanathii TaxID=5486 RepID=A0A367XLG4_9ASCO|nr:Pre-mRNA-splicing factor srp1 [Candida viswanathii]